MSRPLLLFHYGSRSTGPVHLGSKYGLNMLSRDVPWALRPSEHPCVKQETNINMEPQTAATFTHIMIRCRVHHVFKGHFSSYTWMLLTESLAGGAQMLTQDINVNRENTDFYS